MSAELPVSFFYRPTIGFKPVGSGAESNAFVFCDRYVERLTMPIPTGDFAELFFAGRRRISTIPAWDIKNLTPTVPLSDLQQLDIFRESFFDPIQRTPGASDPVLPW